MCESCLLINIWLSASGPSGPPPTAGMRGVLQQQELRNYSDSSSQKYHNYSDDYARQTNAEMQPKYRSGWMHQSGETHFPVHMVFPQDGQNGLTMVPRRQGDERLSRTFTPQQHPMQGVNNLHRQHNLAGSDLPLQFTPLQRHRLPDTHQGTTPLYQGLGGTRYQHPEMHQGAHVYQTRPNTAQGSGPWSARLSDVYRGQPGVPQDHVPNPDGYGSSQMYNAGTLPPKPSDRYQSANPFAPKGRRSSDFNLIERDAIRATDYVPPRQIPKRQMPNRQIPNRQVPPGQFHAAQYYQNPYPQDEPTFDPRMYPNRNDPRMYPNPVRCVPKRHDLSN